MKKILVTGATGFIGNYVIPELLKNNVTVIATSSGDQNAKTASWFSEVQYIPFDLKTFNSRMNYVEYFNKPDAVIHLAWEGLPNYKEDFHITENLPRHFRFLQNLIHNGLSDISITGTCLEYGMQEGCLTEEMPAFPGNSYAIAKDTLRKQLMQLQQEKPFNLKWIRLFHMYGKGQSPKSLISQLNKALEANEPVFNMSGGEQVRDFLPVETVARYITLICMQQAVMGIINCCSGEPVTLKEFVENYLKEQNKSISLNLGYYPYVDHEPMKFWGSTKKLDSIIK